MRNPEIFRLQVPEPAQLSERTAIIASAAGNLPPVERQAVTETLDTFAERWRQCFQRFGQAPAGELSYRDLMLEFEEEIAPSLRARLRAEPARQALAALCTALQAAPPSGPAEPQRLITLRWRAARRESSECAPPLFEQPLFIISAPRSGSTLLFETLATFPDLWTAGEESHALIEGIPALHPAARGYASNRLSAADATPETVAMLRARFALRLQDRDRRAYVDLPAERRPERVRFLEKTPKNALRIPFLRAAFPGARFLVLYRRPEETLASMLEGWRSRRFTAYRPLPGWPYRAWKFLLVPGWETLIHRPLVEIVAHQWRMAYQTILGDLRDLPPDAWLAVRYADLVGAPVDSILRIARFAGLTVDARVERRLQDGLPISSMTFSAPDSEKWRKHAAALETVLPGLLDLSWEIESLCSSLNTRY